MERTPRDVARPAIDRVEQLLSEQAEPVFVAIDGRSGVGKSTVAAEIVQWARASSESIGATLIEGDDFYAGGSSHTWDKRSIQERAAHAFDWRRQSDLLRRLRVGESVSVDPFDWASPEWDRDGIPLSGNVYSVEPARLVVLEGVYSARPELREFFDLRVLIDADPERRRRQLEEREGGHMNTEWEDRWAEAEDHYFAHDSTPTDFDLVIRV